VAAPSVRNRVARAVAVAAVLVLPTACSSIPAEAPAAGAREEVARNVIFVLASGLGQPQREFLRLALAGPTGQLAMDRLAVAGSVDVTPAWDDQTTDSAASATAFATGVRTEVGAVGTGIDDEPLTTVLEVARDAGRATGLVTTGRVTDDGPAAFAAHIAPGPDRLGESAIAQQYLEDTRVDVILGGGEDYWYPPDVTGPHGTRDSKGTRGDLTARATGMGYTYVSEAADLDPAPGEKVLGLFADEEVFGQPGEITTGYAPTAPLPDMTRAALTALDGRAAGFFLVVQEDGIDEMARRNDAAGVLEAGRALERTVEVALEFQADNPGTLIVVAGDHETGGMDVDVTDPGAPAAGVDGPIAMEDSDQELWVDWATDGPTRAYTPITAGGPGADGFEGNILNTTVCSVILQSMSLAKTG
jgi:alkaline phosphatase